MLNSLRAIIRILNVLVVVALLVLHFIIKDTSFYLSLFFYAFPLPIIVLIVLGFSIFLSKKMRKYNLLLAFLLLTIWLGRSFKMHHADAIKATDLEIIFWNASHDNGFEKTFKETHGIPDILVLVESEANDIELLQSKYPHYFFYKSSNEINIFSKTPLQILKESTSKHNTKFINFKTAGINFYALDVQGGLNAPRFREMSFVNSLINKKENTIILGDFNLPYESIYFKNIKKKFNHAFSKKGNGFKETWFWSIPLLSLDHIWVSKDLKILKTEKINSDKSDHSMLKTFIRK